MKAILMAAVLAMTSLAPLPVSAQELPGYNDVKRQLFPTRGRMSKLLVVKDGFLSANQVKVIGAAVRKRPFFGAIAVSPSSGVLGNSATMVFNFHSAANAQSAALSGCESRRGDGDDACAVIALVVPKAYKAPRAVQMNAGATDAFNKEYHKLQGHRAFATSQAAGEWGFAAGSSVADAVAAAVAACAARAEPKGGTDCVAVSAD